MKGWSKGAAIYCVRRRWGHTLNMKAHLAYPLPLVRIGFAVYTILQNQPRNIMS